MIFHIGINGGEYMKKVLISLKNDSLIFSYKIPQRTNIELLNTNLISDNELLFSEDYLKDNIKIVSLFLKELCQEKNLYKVIIETNNLALIILDILKKNPYITAVSIQENATLSYLVYEKLIENKYINYVEADNIQQFMLELLDKKNIHGESRAEVLYLSNFMLSNNLTNFSKIFYKMNIHITEYLKPDDIDDIAAFLNVNKYLKNIHLDVFFNHFPFCPIFPYFYPLSAYYLFFTFDKHIQIYLHIHKIYFAYLLFFHNE